MGKIVEIVEIYDDDDNLIESSRSCHKDHTTNHDTNDADEKETADWLFEPWETEWEYDPEEVHPHRKKVKKAAVFAGSILASVALFGLLRKRGHHGESR